MEEIFTSIAAVVDDTPCCVHVGPGGAGHYVKMVHNGIEYADIQLIAEAYDLLTHVAGLDAPAIAKIFEEWNTGDLDSFLIEITAKVLAKTDEKTGGPLVDVIVDQAEQKGTGTWTAVDALGLGMPLTGITEAVFARGLSALRDERKKASTTLAGPAPGQGADRDDLIEDIRLALYASKVVAYAQGFAQMRAASEANDWNLDLGAMATIWRGGCIIRARFLNRIRDAYAEHGDVENLLMVPYFTEAVANAQDAWRRVVTVATEQGVAIPAFSSSLSYYDGYRRERGPANLIQGLRDFFGAHTYRRIDAEGYFHTRWSQDGTEVQTSWSRRAEVDADGERLGGGEHAGHRAGIGVAELAGEVVGGERDAVAGLAEVDDPVVRDARVGVLTALHRVDTTGPRRDDLDCQDDSAARSRPPSRRTRSSATRGTTTRSGARTVAGRSLEHQLKVDVDLRKHLETAGSWSSSCETCVASRAGGRGRGAATSRGCPPAARGGPRSPREARGSQRPSAVAVAARGGRSWHGVWHAAPTVRGHFGRLEQPADPTHQTSASRSIRTGNGSVAVNTPLTGPASA